MWLLTQYIVTVSMEAVPGSTGREAGGHPVQDINPSENTFVYSMDSLYLEIHIALNYSRKPSQNGDNMHSPYTEQEWHSAPTSGGIKGINHESPIRRWSCVLPPTQNEDNAWYEKKNRFTLVGSFL